jgi:hypothetical protein
VRNISYSPVVRFLPTPHSAAFSNSLDRHHYPALIRHDQNRAGDEQYEMRLVVFASRLHLG